LPAVRSLTADEYRLLAECCMTSDDGYVTEDEYQVFLRLHARQLVAVRSDEYICTTSLGRLAMRCYHVATQLP